MRTLLFTLLLFFNGLFTFSQESKIDSLKSVLSSTTSKEIKLSTLENLNKILISESSLKSSLPYFSEMAEIAKSMDDDELETRAYKYISETYMKEMDSVKAILFAKKALSVSAKNDYLKDYLLNINQLGRVYHHFQYYKKAISTYKLGIEKYEEQPNEKCLSV